MSAAVKPIRAPILSYGAEAPALPTIPFSGGEHIGVPRRRPGPTRSGMATLVPVSDTAAAALEPGALLLVEDGAGLHPVHVARIRTAIGGDLGAEYECVVIDARDQAGRCLTYNPGDLLDAEVDP